jgi:hypothetical protein
MVGSRLLDGFRLGTLDERRVVEPTRKRGRFLLGSFGRFGQPCALGFEVNDAFEWQSVGSAIDNELSDVTRNS